MVAEWKPLFALAKRLNAPFLNTCFGLLKERTFSAPGLAEQIELTIEVLRELSLMAAEFDVMITMELHVDLTSLELVNIIEAVDSEHVQVNLDTANALGRTPLTRHARWRLTCIRPISKIRASIPPWKGITGWAVRRWGGVWSTCRRSWRYCTGPILMSI